MKRLCRPQNIFEHYDSLGGLNWGVAQRFVSKLKLHMGEYMLQPICLPFNRTQNELVNLELHVCRVWKSRLEND